MKSRTDLFKTTLQMRSRVSRVQAAIIAMVATLIGGSPALAAVNYSNTPLQTFTNGVPPNVMLVLDDSGSMSWQYMYNPAVNAITYVDYNGYNRSSKATGDNVKIDNTVQPWSLTVNGVYGVYDQSYATNGLYYNPKITYLPWNINGTRATGGTSLDAVYYDDDYIGGLLAPNNKSATDISGSTLYFYVPISSSPTVSQLGSLTNYYQYSISESWGTITVTECQYTKKNGRWGWNTCVSQTPVSDNSNKRRTAEDEAKNFATWYSYYRTRMKSAKAGVVDAFSSLDKNSFRVGIRTLHNNGGGDSDIPVAIDNGLFRDQTSPATKNRSNWFTSVLKARSASGTPLRSTFKSVGDYFSDSKANGPWGPEAEGRQFTCRQNFAILTTDGYWNTDASSAIGLGDVDGVAGKLIASSETPPQQYTYSPVAPYAAPAANTLADIAMYYWNRDLFPNMINNVPRSADDPAFWQHLVTFSVSIGQRGRLDPATDWEGLKAGTTAWTDPTVAEDVTRIDDLWHAAVNGHGKFVMASDPTVFKEALTGALNTVQERLGSASNVATSSTSLQTNTQLFQGTYQSGAWSGDLSAYPVKDSKVVMTPDWQASSKLPAYSSRSIYTWGNNRGEAFPTTSQSGSLALTLDGVAFSGANIADYLKGDAKSEVRNGGKLRNRARGALGDIVNSSPVYVESTQTIFVGANDGMLHGFNSVDGVERFAYVPAGVDMVSLRGTADPAYSHRWFVDGQIAVTDSALGNGKSYLIGALGRGGRGIYGLDVTNPSSFDSKAVLWDNTATNIPNDMGQVLGLPIAGKLSDGQSVVLVPNGINSTTGDAALFIINPATGAVLKTLKVNGATNNGLMEIGVLRDPTTGVIKAAYGGDLVGNVWKFDLSGGVLAAEVGLSGRPLFNTGAKKPVTGGIAVMTDPNDAKKTWVLFGTGQLLSALDLTDKTTQTMYGVIDTGTPVVESALQKRSFLGDAGYVSGKLVRAFEKYSELPADKRGWYVDMSVPTGSGERMIGRPYFDKSGMLVFSSIIPPTDNTCEPGGKGFLNAIDPLTGTGSKNPFLDLNGDGKFDELDMLTVTYIGADGKPTTAAVGAGSVDLGIGMLTTPIGVGDQVFTGGSRGGVGQIQVNQCPSGNCSPPDPPCTGPKCIYYPGNSGTRNTWREIVAE